MKLPGNFAVGVCTHTGRVRVNNEDDYLLGALGPEGGGLLFCGIADGMGGAAGGAEASRTALRALAAAVLDGAAATPLTERLRAGFAAAARRVWEQAQAVPSLRGMGTTLTALCLESGRASISHVGDTRAYRCRDGVVEQLTVDHAVREPDNLLTRCIGGGQATCEVDHRDLDVRRGDRFVLLTDGIWSVVPMAAMAQFLRLEPQAAAEALVGAALAAGGPDNATAVVAVVGDPVGADSVRELDLPHDERPRSRDLWPRPASLRAPWWPWALLLAAGVVAAATLLRWATGFDVWASLRSWLPG